MSLQRSLVAGISAAGLCIALSAAVPAAPAAADVSGPCTGSIAGVDAASRSATDPDDAIDVDADDTVTVVVDAPQPLDEYEIRLSFAGFSWTVATGSTDGASWTRTVEVSKYSRFGVGLYQVHAVSTGDGEPCEGAVLVRVGGSPFATVAGWVALGFTALGVGATAAAARPGRRRVPAGAMALGALGGLGAIALAQQFAVAYPTRTLAVVGILAGIAAPLVGAQIASAVGGSAAGASHPGAPTDLPQGPLGDSDLPRGPVGDSDLPQGPGVNGWTPDRVIPPSGLPSWGGPDPAAPPSHPLEGGVPVRVLGRLGDRVHVECSNGWTTWLDASALDVTA